MLISKYAPEEFDQEDQNEEIYYSESETRNNKVLLLDICKIIDSKIWWKEIRQLEKLLLPFCGALNKLQADNARLHDVLYSFGYFYKIWQEYFYQDLGKKMISHLEKKMIFVFRKTVVYLGTTLIINFFSITP